MKDDGILIRKLKKVEDECHRPFYMYVCMYIIMYNVYASLTLIYARCYKNMYNIIKPMFFYWDVCT